MYREIADKECHSPDQCPRPRTLCIHKETDGNATGVGPQVPRRALTIEQVSTKATCHAGERRGKKDWGGGGGLAGPVR